ncbi:MAG: hypothetical protein ACLTAI_14445 [Thomasclavelia sp.]
MIISKLIFKGEIYLCEIEKFLEDLKSGKAITGGSHEHELMHYLAEDAMLKTAQLNNSYHDAKIRRQLFSEIIGKPVDDTFAIFPPFIVNVVKYLCWKKCFY